MAESAIMKSLNGRKVYDEDARKEMENIKNAAPGLVFDTVADMEAYIAENADTLKVGQDLFIRAADVPDYWWDGTAAVPVETELGEVKKEIAELSEAIGELENKMPTAVGGMTAAQISALDGMFKVAAYSVDATVAYSAFRKAFGIPDPDSIMYEHFDKTRLIDPGNQNSFITVDGVEYYRYNAGANNFEYPMSNPQVGAVTITMRAVPQYTTTYGTAVILYYSDGSQERIILISNGESNGVVTYTTPASKTLVRLTGNYDLENWVLLDMSVMSLLAKYPPSDDTDTPETTDKVWTDGVLELSIGDIMVGYGRYGSYPYYTERASRAGYYLSDISVEPGDYYTFEYDPKISTTDIAIQFWGNAAKTARNNKQSGVEPSSMGWDSGWQSSGYTIKCPDVLTNGDAPNHMTITFRVGENETDVVTADFISYVKLTRKTLTGISAVYSGGDAIAGSAASQLSDVVVTATYSDGSSNTVTGYTLSGTITEGENTITVSYDGFTATFTVTGVAGTLEWETVRTLTADDLMFGYGQHNDPPYYGVNAPRAGYWFDDIPAEDGPR